MFRDNAVFIGGASCGVTKSCSASNAATKFDPSTNMSSYGILMSTPRYGHASAVVNNSIIVCGGCTGNGSFSQPLRDCEQYAPTREKWSAISDLSQARCNSRMVQLNDLIYIFGGEYFGSSLSSNVYQYDASDTWTFRTAMTTALTRYAAVSISADIALVCGGIDSNKNTTSMCSTYSSSNNSWASAMNMTTARSGHDMVVLDGKCTHTHTQIQTSTGAIYIVGGRDATGAVLNTVELYTMKDGGKTMTKTMAVADADISAVAIQFKCIYY